MLTIDLSAIQQNWLTLRRMGNGAAVAGVIKANAYGLGAAKVGCALYDVGCREFFFATIDEALAGRSFLPHDAVIYLLGSSIDSYELQLIDSNIIPVLNSLHAIGCWAKKNAELSCRAPSAIKLNTGMTRFGLDENEFDSVCNDPILLDAVNPVLLISHLACADEPGHPLNAEQLHRFSCGMTKIKRQIPQIRFSLANSSGIFLGEKWHFDLLRPGAALYGINPTLHHLNPMLPVLRLSLPVRQVRTLVVPAVLGYGGQATLPQGARVVVVAGGYADGLNRTLGPHPEGILCGRVVHGVGRISMDAMIFDVSLLGESNDTLLGESIEVISPQLTLGYLSKKNNLLGYEVLTSLGARYVRNYIGGC